MNAWGLQLLERLQPDVVQVVGDFDDDAVARMQRQIERPALREVHARTGGIRSPLVMAVGQLSAMSLASANPLDDVTTIAGLGMLRERERDIWTANGATIFDGTGAHLNMKTDAVLRANWQAWGYTIAATSTHSLRALWSAGRMSAFGVLWVAKANSLPDAIHFWNLRTLYHSDADRAPILIVNPDVATDPAFIETFRTLLLTKTLSAPDVLMVSLSLSADQLAEIAAAHAFAPHAGSQFETTFIGQPQQRDLKTDPLTFKGRLLQRAR